MSAFMFQRHRFFNDIGNVDIDPKNAGPIATVIIKIGRLTAQIAYLAVGPYDAEFLEKSCLFRKPVGRIREHPVEIFGMKPI